MLLSNVAHAYDAFSVVTILEHNLQGTAGFNCGFVSRKVGLFNSSEFSRSGILAYGLEIICRAKHLKSQLDPDSTLIKLMLVILTFSSNCLIMNVPKTIHNDKLLEGTFRLFGSQNVYADYIRTRFYKFCMFI